MSRFTLVPFLSALLLLAACGGGGGPVPAPLGEDVDTESPSTNAAPESGDFDAEIEVVLTASEPATIQVSINGAEFVDAGESPVSLRITEGVTTLEYFAVDAAGNVEAPARTQRYLVDLSPPVLTLPNGDPTALPWLATAVVEWQSDEECDYVVSVVETGEILDEGLRTIDATTKIEVPAADLPDEPITVRIEATDWTGRTSNLDFVLERAASTRVETAATPGDVIVLPAGDRAFIARRFQSKIDVLDLETEEIVESIDVGIRAWSMTLNADASLLYVSNGIAPGEIVTVDVDSYDVESVSQSVGVPGAVAFSADGDYGYFTDFAGAIRVLDTNPSSADFHAVVDSIDVDDDLLSGRVVVGPQRDFLLVNWSGLGLIGVKVVGFGEGAPSVRTAWTSSVPAPSGQSNAIVLSEDGAQAYVSSVKLLCGLCRFDLDADELVHAGDDPDAAAEPGVEIGGEEIPDVPWGIALIDSDTALLTVGPNGKYVRLYDADSMEHRSRYLIGAGANSIAVTPDGRRAVISRSVGTEDEVVIVPLR